ncbi:hypothetical protein D3C81_2256330 [compost metagenome]
MGGHRLARAALADQGQGFALADVEVDAIDRAHQLAAAEEFHRQVAYFDQVFAVLLAHLTSSDRMRRGRLRR